MSAGTRAPTQTSAGRDMRQKQKQEAGAYLACLH
jgi:hypothetical protein